MCWPKEPGVHGEWLILELGQEEDKYGATKKLKKKLFKNKTMMTCTRYNGAIQKKLPIAKSGII